MQNRGRQKFENIDFRRGSGVKERGKCSIFGKKERQSFSSKNRYFIDSTIPTVLINWQNRR
jgi:hypothetical protein